MLPGKRFALGFAALAQLAAVASARQTWLTLEEALLGGADTGAGDRFGAAVAIHGDTAIVGAPNAGPDERGAAYVFVRANGAWTQQAELSASLGATGDFDHFGASVAVLDDTAAVGAPDWESEDGRVYLFVRAGSTWTADAVLGPPTTGYYYRFGAAVAFGGPTLAVSAPLFGALHEGAVATFENIAGAWTFDQWLVIYTTLGDNRVGERLAVLPNAPWPTVVASSRNRGAEGFRQLATGWQSWFSIGLTSRVEALAGSGATLALGVPSATVGGAADAGRVSLWRIDPNGPMPLASIAASDASAGDRFGASVALDGDVLVVGAPFDDDAPAVDAGAVYWFERSGSTWSERAKLAAAGAASGDRFPSELAIAGSELVAGVPDDSTAAGALSGSARAIRFGYPTLTYCTEGASSSGCVARIAAAGTPSASLSTAFSIQVTGADAQREGIVFYGVGGPLAAPWNGSSFLCVGPPVQRTGSQSSGGSAGACDGALALDWNAFAAANPAGLGQPFAAGERIWAQGWYRDPPSPKTTQLSSALGFVLGP